MCGRIANTLPHDAMARLFSAVPANDLPDVPNYNICPTDTLAVVTSEEGTRRLRPMRWGLLPPWYKTTSDRPLLINARAETVAAKRTFAEAVRERRCLIPASGFYEWSKSPEGDRLPWFVSRADGEPLVLAGLWQDWERNGERLTTCAVVTTAANDTMGNVHTRMPVVIEPADWPLWLGEAGHGAAVLMHAAPEEALRLYRVDREVNSNRASGPQLIEPAGA